MFMNCLRLMIVGSFGLATNLFALQGVTGAVRDYLVARGEQPAEIDDEIYLRTTTKAIDRQVGEMFSFTTRITDMPSKTIVFEADSVELLVIGEDGDDGRNLKVIPSVLKQWEGDDGQVTAVLRGSRWQFGLLYLNDSLPANSRLVVVVRRADKYSVTATSPLPIASRDDNPYRVRNFTVTHFADQQRVHWLTEFSSDIPKKSLIGYYITDQWGTVSEVKMNSPIGSGSPLLALWGDKGRWLEGCYSLVVALFETTISIEGDLQLNALVVSSNPFQINEGDNC